MPDASAHKPSQLAVDAMKEIDGDKILIYVVSIALAIVAAVFINKIPRTRGKNPIFHAIYAAASIALLFLLPEEIQDTVFSPGGVGKLNLA